MQTSIFEDEGKQLEKFSCHPFPSWSSAAKDSCELFQFIYIAIVKINKNERLFFGFP